VTTGGRLVTFTDTRIQALANQLFADERGHVLLLQQLIRNLGGTPIVRPNLNLAALGFGFGSQNDFLTVARVLEDVGVTAYASVVPLINSKGIVGPIARILATEGLHSGAIRDEISRGNINTTAVDPVDRPAPPSGNQLFPTDANGLVETRTPAQVLFLAFGSKATANAGGFFPAGVNGGINAASTIAAPASGTQIISASPNPILVSGSDTAGTTVITFNAPVSATQLRLNSPDGLLLLNAAGSGSFSTGPFVSDGTTFYLQDASSGNPASAANTLGTVVVRVQKRT